VASYRVVKRIIQVLNIDWEVRICHFYRESNSYTKCWIWSFMNFVRFTLSICC